MIDNKIITGDNRLPVMKALKNDRTIMQMSLAGTNFTRLTVVNEIARKNDHLHFIVNCPQGFREAAASVFRWVIFFSFSGEEGIPHVFETSGGEFLENNTLLLRFPETIRQNQRRRHARIKLAPGSRLTARSSDKQYAMAINDISEGGALVMNETPCDPPRQLLKKDQALTDLYIDLTPDDPEKEPISIERATVRRVAVSASSGNFHYGLMFTDISEQEAKRLKESIDLKNYQKPRKKLKVE